MKNITIYFLMALISFNTVPLPLCAESSPFEWKRAAELFLRVYQDTKDDNSFEDKQMIDSRIKFKNRIHWKRQDIFFHINLEGRGEVFRGDDFDEDFDWFLKEAYIEMRRKNFNFSVGRQIITWGKLDDVAILDRMSPQEYQWFILIDKQKRKLPVFLFKYDYYGENWEVESVFIPTFKPSYLRFFGSDWAIFDHSKRSIAQGNFSAATKDVVNRIKIQERDELTGHTFDNAQFGIRFRSRLGEVDYALYYMYINNSLPTLREKTATGNILKKFLYIPTAENLSALVGTSPTDEDLTLLREHPKSNVFGVDWETILGEVGLRGEIGYLSGLPYLRDNFSYVRKDTVSFGVGLDHTTANNFYVNLQFIEDYIIQYEPLFVQEENTHRLTGTFKKDFLRGDLFLNLDWMVNVSNRDWMLNPQIRYTIADGFDVSIGGFIFGGDLTTVLGRFSSKDVVYLGLKYSF